MLRNGQGRRTLNESFFFSLHHMTQINRVMKYLYNGVGSPLAGAAEAVRIQAGCFRQR